MKKITIFLALLIMLVTVLNFLAVNVDAYDYGAQISTIDGKKDTSKASTSTQNVVGAILQVARIAAIGVALIMLTVLAMKYMYSAPGDRAEIKKHAVVYIVGAVVLFASSGILGIIKDFAEKNVKSSSAS